MVSNEDKQSILASCALGIPELETSTGFKRSGHCGMTDDPIPKQLLYGELEQGKLKVGGQKLCYTDIVKRHLKAVEYDTTNREDLTRDRVNWRGTLHDGREKIQHKIVAASELRHYRRHNLGTHWCLICGKLFHTTRRMLQHRRIVHGSPS